MNLFDDFLNDVKNNREGEKRYIPTGLPKYDKYVYGTRQGCYYLYGGETGTGKTKFVRDRHVYQAYDFVKDRSDMDIAIIDFSLEISAKENLANAVSRRLYLENKIICPPDKILSWNNPLPLSILSKIESYSNYYEEMLKKIFIVEEETTPELYHDILLEFFKNNGTFERDESYIGKCGKYTPNNPNLYVIVILDTINLGDEESSGNIVKRMIDRISRTGVYFRNRCNATIINIQQFNAEISAVDRGRYGIKTPLLRDFEDSKRPSKDANVVIGLFDPMRHMKEEDTTFKGYDITILKSWFKSLHLLKNRNGETNKFVPLKFEGATSSFKQLPPAKDMGEQEYINATKYET